MNKKQPFFHSHVRTKIPNKHRTKESLQGRKRERDNLIKNENARSSNEGTKIKPKSPFNQIQ